MDYKEAVENTPKDDIYISYSDLRSTLSKRHLTQGHLLSTHLAQTIETTLRICRNS
jgi:hypothetical protein